MVLLRELLDHEVVQRDRLLRERLRLAEALGREHHLGDHREVGRHHRDRPHERLEVVGQLGAARVAGVHRDEEAGARVARDHLAHEVEDLELAVERVHDAQHLLRDDREHLDLDAVELVEAAPRARLAQPRENAADRLEVVAVGAVDDDDVVREVLAEVLDRLGLARARGPERVAAAVEELGREQREDAAVGERRDDEPPVVALVLVAVLEDAVGLAHAAQPELALVLREDEAQLRHPLEVRGGGALGLDQLLHHVAVVDLHRDERDEPLAHDLGQRVADHLGHAVEEADLLLLGLLHRVLRAARDRDERLRAVGRPLDRARRDEQLALPVVDPLLLLAAVARDRAGEQLLHAEEHRLLELAEPDLDRAVEHDVRDERGRLALGRDHAEALEVAVHLLARRDDVHLREALEVLVHVALHRHRVARLAEDLEQVVVRDEVEARERHALRLEVLVEALLDALELGVHRAHAVEHARLLALADRVRVVGDRAHDRLERVVHLGEERRLLGQLLVDVAGRHEDRLEVHPLALDREQHVDDLAHEAQARLPEVDLLLERAVELGRLHRRERDRVVLEHLVQVVGGLDLEVHLLVLGRVDDDVDPPALDRLERRLDRELLVRVARELADEVGDRGEPDREHLLEREVDARLVEVLVQLGLEVVPVALAQRGVLEVRDERHRVDELAHRLLHELPDVPARDLALELADLLRELARLVGHVLDVELVELARLPRVEIPRPVLAQRPHILGQLEVLLRLGELLRLGQLGLEQVEAHLEPDLPLLHGLDLRLELADLLERGLDLDLALGRHLLGEARVQVDTSRLPVLEAAHEVALHVLLRLLEHRLRVDEHLLELAPRRVEARELLHLVVRDLHVELGERRVHLLERRDLRLDRRRVALQLAQALDRRAQVLEVARRLLQLARLGLELVVQRAQDAERVLVEQPEQLVLPLHAVVHERRLEQRAVDLDEVDRVGVELVLNVRLLLAVLGHVVVVVLERAVRLGVAPHVRLLVHLPDRLVLVPVAQVLLELGRRARHAVHHLHDDLEHVLVVRDDRVERRELLRRGGLAERGVGALARRAVVGRERLLQPRHDGDRRDELFRDDVDDVRQVDHRRAVVDAVVLEHDLHAEERLRLGLGVAVDRARQLLQRALDGRAQRLLDLLVRLLDELAPLALHLGAAVLEVDVELLHRLLDVLVRGLEALLDVPPVARLLLLEDALVVEHVLVDLEQQHARDEAAVARDPVLAVLEALHDRVRLGAVRAAVLHVELDDVLRGPRELGEALVDALVEPADVVVEEPALVGREVREDVVVRAHDEHHVLAHHAQLLALVADVVRVDGDDELGVQLLPVVHLGEEREQALVEVALEVRVLALGDERGRDRVLGARAPHERVLEPRMQVARVERL